MAQDITKNRLINFTNLPCETEQQRDCHREAFNSLMINASQFDRYEEVEQFTHCQKKQCEMVLTIQDKDYIDDWNWVSSNEQHYKEVADKVKIMSQNKWNYFIWNCRFCGTKNLISKQKAYFAKNKSKVVIKQGKTAQQNYISEQPLLLFLIDNSSSMQEQIPQLVEQIKMKNNNNNGNSGNTKNKNDKPQINAVVNDVLRKTNIYQKITENQKKILSQIKKQIDPDTKAQPYIDHMSKYKILMSMTEKTVNDLCQKKGYTEKKLQLKQNSENKTRKIGFMFFNSNVIMQKISGKKEKKVIKVSQKQQFEKESLTEGHIKVDFNNFNSLYAIGKNNSENYGTDITNFKFSDIELSEVTPTGQTALGPALCIAAGIVSGYGAGSLIVIVTDGRANKGIFREEDIYEKQIKILKMRLDKSRAQTCIMRLQTNPEVQKPQIQSSLQKFFRKNSTIINVSLKQNDPLKELQNRLMKILEKLLNSNTWVNEIKIKCQNPNIKYDSDLKKKNKNKLFKDQQSQFYRPYIDENKLTAFDYKHPFMTQVLVRYQDINTKQQSKFMAFLMQKIIKYDEMSKKDEETLQSVETLHNVLSYLEVEGESFDLSNIPLSFCKQSFRSTIMESFKHSMQRSYKKQLMADSSAIEMIQLLNKQKPVIKNPKDLMRSLMSDKPELETTQIYDKL